MTTLEGSDANSPILSLFAVRYIALYSIRSKWKQEKRGVSPIAFKQGLKMGWKEMAKPLFWRALLRRFSLEKFSVVMWVTPVQEVGGDSMSVKETYLRNEIMVAVREGLHGATKGWVHLSKDEPLQNSLI